MPDGSATAHLYRPKLATVLAEGYNLGHFRKDMLAALTVAIVALPLSMAIAVFNTRLALVAYLLILTAHFLPARIDEDHHAPPSSGDPSAESERP